MRQLISSSRAPVLWAGALLALVSIDCVAAPRLSYARRQNTTDRVAGRSLYPNGGRLLRESRIGGADADEESDLNRVRSFLLARDGSVWVIDGRRGASQLRRFSADGKLIRTVGRIGSGPGEYRLPTGLAQLKDGRVLLRDGELLNRITLFTERGDFDTTWTFSSTIHSAMADKGGLVWLVGAANSGVVAAGRGTGPSARLLTYARFRPDTKRVDTVVAPLRPPPDRETFKVRYRGNEQTLVSPYQPSALFAWSPLGYYAEGVSTRYEINVRAPVARSSLVANSAPLLFTIRRNVQPVHVTEDERRDQRESLASRPGQEGSVPGIPRQKPPIRAIQFADDGSLWVLTAQPSRRTSEERIPRRGPAGMFSSRWFEPSVWDAYDANGRFLGAVDFPTDGTCDRHSDLRIGAASVLCLATDADGVEYIDRYRIEWRPGQ